TERAAKNDLDPRVHEVADLADGAARVARVVLDRQLDLVPGDAAVRVDVGRGLRDPDRLVAEDRHRARLLARDADLDRTGRDAAAPRARRRGGGNRRPGGENRDEAGDHVSSAHVSPFGPRPLARACGSHAMSRIASTVYISRRL